MRAWKQGHQVVGRVDDPKRIVNNQGIVIGIWKEMVNIVTGHPSKERCTRGMMR